MFFFWTHDHAKSIRALRKHQVSKFTDLGGETAPKGTLHKASENQQAFAKANSLLQKVELLDVTRPKVHKPSI